MLRTMVLLTDVVGTAHPTRNCLLCASAPLRAMFLALVLLSGSVVAGAEPLKWQPATPESQGMSGVKLEALRESLAARKTTGFLVIRNDRIVCEWYAEGHSATRPHYTASMAKAIVGGLSCAVALTDGKLSLDDPASKFIPQWQNDPQKSKITLRQLGSHTSGLEDAEADGLPHNQLTGWKGDFWKRLDVPNDPFSISRDKAPLLFPPGEKLAYSNPGIAMLTYAVTAAIADGPHKDIRTLLRERIMRPLGVPDAEWSCGYGQTFTTGGLPLVASWGGGNYTARAVARICRLMLRGGDWEGTRLLSEDAIRQTTSDAGTPGTCGIGWWSNNEGRYAKLPRDAFWGAGAGHQICLVVPSLNLIVVRNGESLGPLPSDPTPMQYHEPVRELLFEPLIDAVLAPPGRRPTKPRAADEALPSSSQSGGGRRSVSSTDRAVTVSSSWGAGWQAVVDRRRGGVITELRIGGGPNLVSNDGNRFAGLFNTIYVDFQETGKDQPIRYTYELAFSPPLPPSSPVIAELQWAPKETIIRKAKGGDNWPMTWADDDHQYTAYGDGWGFEPQILEKLSMGLCRVEGGPDDFRGVNLRSPTFETKGEGMRGVKASGLLMVDGVLYLLARNAGNSQLAWSADHGQTWTWSDWKFTTSFGCPTFLNFGKNYAGARDEYVYVYSLDHDSAYEPADRFVLARVPKRQIKERAAYEFFKGLDASGAPTWTKDVSQRGAVFSHRGKCYRCGITYSAPLKRYLWCQILHTSRHPQGPRFQGGFGVYDAPEPWGPWTTVYYTDDWDVGPGETSSFPTKWMSADGKTLHLVFSGDDHFSVRRATFVLRQ